MRAGYHVNASRHHCCRVDQSRDRCRAFHGIRQPDVERNLRGLTRRPHHQKERDWGKKSTLPFRMQGDLRKDSAEAQGPEMCDKKKERNQETEITNTVDHKGLF